LYSLLGIPLIALVVLVQLATFLDSISLDVITLDDRVAVAARKEGFDLIEVPPTE
jgi:hypothetical protein